MGLLWLSEKAHSKVEEGAYLSAVGRYQRNTLSDCIQVRRGVVTRMFPCRSICNQDQELDWQKLYLIALSSPFESSPSLDLQWFIKQNGGHAFFGGGIVDLSLLLRGHLDQLLKGR